MKRTLLNICFLTVAVLGIAAVPKNGDNALKEIKKRYRDVKTLQAHFKESFRWQLTGEAVDREGELIVAEGNRFRVETPEQTMVSDGKALYRFSKTKNQVMIEAVEKSESLLPNRVLLNFGDEFDAVGLAALPVEGKEGYSLDLKPRSPDKALLASATLWVTSEDRAVRRIRIVDLNGNSTTYSLSKLTFDSTAAPELFVFKLPAGAEIFDLR